MNLGFIIYSIGKLLQMLAPTMLLPLSIGIFEQRPVNMNSFFLYPDLFGLSSAIVLSLFCGTLFTMLPRHEMKGNAVKEGFAIVTLGWIILTFFGSIPLFIYLHSGPETQGVLSIANNFIDAYFETMSGFTTTGATILPDVESLPRSILFWRSMTHWLGGMGIVTLVLSVFPAFGFTAYQMFRGEVPGPTPELLRPRLAQTTKILWGVYALLTLAETILLMFGGMDWFDASCHAFGTMATGGFSTKNSSIAAYSSAYIDWVIIIFMFMAGMNFIIHYKVIFSGDFRLLKSDKEFKFYLSVILLAVFISFISLQITGISSPRQVSSSFRDNPLTEKQIDKKITVEKEKTASIFSKIRHSAFQVVSLTTTTGYCTADFDVWPNSLRIILVVLMFFGGCAGSTGGGIKMVRIMVVLKAVHKEIKKMIQPKLVAPVKLADTPLPKESVANIVAFFTLFILLFSLFSIVMSFFISDFTTAVTSVVATMCNIGPGLSGIGATENYAWIPSGGKAVLIFCMLLGRLEVYTVIIALSPVSWKK